MTHADLIDTSRGYRSGCPGLIDTQGEFPDPVRVPEPPGFVIRFVRLWICRGCGWFLTECKGEVLEAIPPPPISHTERLGQAVNPDGSPARRSVPIPYEPL
jgi:hypothetical protein